MPCPSAHRPAGRRPGRRARVCGPTRRAGFSLVEMLVALAVVVIALSVVTTVFALTTRTTQTARGLSEVNQSIRAFLFELEQDLRQVNPAESVLVLSGWTQAAALTEEDVQAARHLRFLTGDARVAANSSFDPVYDATTGRLPANEPFASGYSDPRSDAIMFFTSRPGVSRAPRTNPPAAADLADAARRFQRTLYDGTAVGPQLVLYGHAALGRAFPLAGGGFSWPALTQLEHISQDVNGSYAGDRISRVPVLRWQLTRRAALLQPLASSLAATPDIDALANNGALGEDRGQQMLRLTQYRPSANGQVAGDSLALDLRRYLDQFSPGSPSFASASPPNPAAAVPYRFPNTAMGSGGGGWTVQARDLIHGLLYRDITPAVINQRHFATVIENAPPQLQSNLGLSTLPACVWFQVEFLLPEDPRNSRQHGESAQWDDTPRWVQIDPGQTYVFVPDSPENRLALRQYLQPTGIGSSKRREFVDAIDTATIAATTPNVPVYYIRTWPWAIRVTVRAYDTAGKLPEPIVRTYVHRFD